MSPLDLHVLSTPPAFVLSQDQTLMFNPYPQLIAYSRPARQSRPLSPFRQGVSLFQNLTVIDASSRLPALFVDLFLYKMTFSVSFSRIALLSFASLATTSRIISKGLHFVNPLFSTFPIPNSFREFERNSAEITELCHFFPEKHPGTSAIASILYAPPRSIASSILNITTY